MERRKKYGDGKVDYHSTRHYFVGYDAKAESIYSVWNPSDDSIIRERNIIFDETLYFQGEALDLSPLSFSITELEPGMVEQLIPDQDVTDHQSPVVSPSPPTIVDTLPQITTTATHSSMPFQPPPPPTPTSALSSDRPTARSEVISNYSLRSKGSPPVAMLSFLQPAPDNYRDAIHSPERELWKAAHDEEYTSLMENNTWTLVPPPPDANIVDSRWAHAIKDELPPRYKARFVAKGYSQRYGVNYEETYAPVVKPETLRVLFSISTAHKYNIHMMDAVTAFLNSILAEKIYVKQPEGYVNSEHPDWVCLLHRALYGLKQSALAWYDTLRMVLESPELEFKRIESVHAVFVVKTQLSTMYLALFVDDMAIFGDNEHLIGNIKAELSSHFRMKDLGLMKQFISLDIS